MVKNGKGIGSGVSNPTAGAGAGPVNTVLPAITGTASVGSTLSCSQGTWTGSPTGFSYQWLRNGAPIGGATANTYVVASTDQGTTISCAVTATSATGSTSVLATGAVNIPPPPPVNVTLPVISGTPAVGSTLTCSTGTWQNSPTGYTYQWLSNGSNIAGATSSTYLVVSGDQGNTISCTVTASNATGSASATSSGVSIPSPPPSAPVNTVLPAISGSTSLGATLTCSSGTWTNSPTSYTYQWIRNGTNISGATSPTYVIVSADQGTTLTCTVVATNAGGSTPATSNGYAIPAAGPGPQLTLTQLATDNFNRPNGTITTTTAYRDLILSESGLVSYWRLDEASGNFADQKAVSTAVVSGTVTHSATGLVADTDTAASTAGTTGPNANAPYNSAYNTGNAMTIECWVKIGTYVQGPDIVGRHLNWTTWWLGETNNTGFRFYVRPASGADAVIDTNNTIVVGTNQHLVGVYDSVAGRAELWVNGVKAGSVTPASGAITNSSSQGIDFFAQGTGNTSMNGTLDEVSFYNVALSPAQIAAHYAVGAGTNNWATPSDGSANIVSNEGSGVGGSIAGNYRTGTYTVDQYAQCNVGSVNSVSGSFIGLTLRHNTSTNADYAGLYFNNSGQPQLAIYYRTAPGAYTQIGATNISTLPVGTLLTFYVIGSVLVLQAGTNGALGQFSVNDTHISAGGQPGITTFGTMTFDNWAAGNASMGAALGAVVASDNFNRANGNVATGQPLWTPITATFSGVACTGGTIVSNEMKNTSSGHEGDSRGDTYNNDHWAQIAMGSINPIIAGTAPFLGAIVRWDGSKGYQCVYFAGGSAPGVSHRIYLVQNGSASTLLASIPIDGNGGSASPSTPTGTTFMAVAVGSRISMRVNGTEVLSVVDSTIATGQPAYLTYPTVTLDNFSAGNV